MSNEQTGSFKGGVKLDRSSQYVYHTSCLQEIANLQVRCRTIRQGVRRDEVLQQGQAQWNQVLILAVTVAVGYYCGDVN